MLRLISKPQLPWVVGLLVLPAAILSRSTGGASLLLMFLSGTVWIVTAVIWATNAHSAWDRSVTWTRERPVQRVLLAQQVGESSSNPAARVFVVMGAAVFGLAQVGVGIAGLVMVL